MRLTALVTATGLGLAEFATAYLLSRQVGTPAAIRVVARAVGCAAELQINDEPQ
jgi:hypothetical protein